MDRDGRAASVVLAVVARLYQRASDCMLSESHALVARCPGRRRVLSVVRAAHGERGELAEGASGATRIRAGLPDRSSSRPRSRDSSARMVARGRHGSWSARVAR